MTYYMGIDGGGSNLRVVITDEALNVIGKAHRGTANPSSIGHELSASRIRDAMREALLQAGNPIIDAVSLGIAGASVDYARDWLISVVADVLPDARHIPASDNEIALVGARGERLGILLLAGTGSVAFGMNKHGESLQVGGWGYLLGDEASGFWLGNYALKLTIRDFDDTLDTPTNIPARVMETLELNHVHELLEWLYVPKPLRVADVAKLARIMLEEAEQGDPYALGKIEQGAAEMILLGKTLERRLSITEPHYVFAGGILSSDNLLSRKVAEGLTLDSLPLAKHEPVIGAALLAKLVSEESHD